MKKVFDWVKRNKLAFLLFLIIGWLLLKSGGGGIVSLPARMAYDRLPAAGGGMAESSIPTAGGLAKTIRAPSYPLSESAPQPDAEDRLVVEESNTSLLVENVREEVDRIISYTETKGGYMVSSSISHPQEAPFATLIVRLPSQELKPALEYLRGLAVKVTSENLIGWDVTDKYIDLQSRLETLDKTKAKFEKIMDQAVKVDDILRVQREIINLQQQIDNLKGRQEYLKKTAENAKLTVYLSTDEWALPYTPKEPAFRPKVIFKQAVRSLVLSSRSLVKAGIWIVVYGAIGVPVVIVYLILKKKKKKH